MWENINSRIYHIVRLNGWHIEQHDKCIKVFDNLYCNTYWNIQRIKSTILQRVFKPFEDLSHTLYSVDRCCQNVILQSCKSLALDMVYRSRCCEPVAFINCVFFTDFSSWSHFFSLSFAWIVLSFQVILSLRRYFFNCQHVWLNHHVMQGRHHCTFGSDTSH